MKYNLSSVDRAIRVFIAVALAALYFFGVVSGTAGIVLLVIAAVIAVTAFIGFCPIYAALGIRTLSKP
jgi:hypothetical protein